MAAVRVNYDTREAPLLSRAPPPRGVAPRRTLAAVGPVLVRWAALLPEEVLS